MGKLNLLRSNIAWYSRLTHHPLSLVILGGNTLSDDLLLKLFCYCQPVIFGDDDDQAIEVKKWDCERWWYNLAQVCQKWRYLVFKSAYYLDICLFCSYGTLVAEMLMHSPPLPLVIDYSCED